MTNEDEDQKKEAENGRRRKEERRREERKTHRAIEDDSEGFTKGRLNTLWQQRLDVGTAKESQTGSDESQT